MNTTSNRPIAAALFATLLTTTATQAFAQERSASAPAALFAPLRPGVKVTLEEKGALVSIKLLNDGSLGSHAVIEVGAQHIVLDDFPGITRHWIPLTAVREVVWVRVPR